MPQNTKILFIGKNIKRIAQLLVYLNKKQFQFLHSVSTYSDAIDHIEKKNPDIIILGFLLADNSKNGFDVAHYIHANTNIPILYMASIEEALLMKNEGYNIPITYFNYTLANFFHNLSEGIIICIKMIKNAPCKHPDMKCKVIELAIQIDGISSLVDKNFADYFPAKISANEILFIEAGNDLTRNTSRIWTKDNKQHCFQVRDTLDHILMLLNNADLIRIHHTYIININAISKEKYPGYVMIGKHKINFGESYVDKLYQRFHIDKSK